MRSPGPRSKVIRSRRACLNGSQGVRLTPSESPAAFAQYVERDVARWTALMREFNFTVN